MANESKKDFNAMLNNSKDMPVVKIIEDEKTISRYGGNRMYMAPPIEYDRVMKQVPYGKVLTADRIRAGFAAENDADFTCPLTAGIFINIAAWASEQRDNDKTPYWRTLKTGGELNPKYPGGVDAQRGRLEEEGHRIATRGKKNLKYYVEDLEESMYEPK